MQILLCLYTLDFLDTLDFLFLVTNIFLEERMIHFSDNLSNGIDLAINFDLVKCITKNKYT